MDEFMKEFMEGMKDVFPQLLVQFEDFSTDNAFRYLDMFRNQYRCFNDDVCGILSFVVASVSHSLNRSKALVSCVSEYIYRDLTRGFYLLRFCCPIWLPQCRSAGFVGRWNTAA